MLISHNLHDIFEVADRITVLRLGQRVNVFTRADATQQQVVHAITAGSSSAFPGSAGKSSRERPPPSGRRARRRAGAAAEQ